MANTTISQIQFENDGQLLDIKPLVDYIYPIGAVYVSTVLVDPAVLFGGVWNQIQGKFLLSADNTYTAGTTGGSATVILETANLPSHSHSIGAHAHSLNAHTHSVGAHAHSLNNHTHTGPSHIHTGPSHTHSGPSHTHTTTVYENRSGFTHNGTNLWILGGNSTPSSYGTSQINHPSGTGATGAAGTGATGAAGTGATGGPSVANTGNSTAFNSGGPSTTNTGNSTAFDSGTTGSGTAHNNMPPYLAVYMWERVA